MTTLTRLAAPAVLIAALAAAGIATAGGDQRHGPGLDFGAMDADSDASLSRAELTARATARLAEPDANGDGALDRDELVATMPGPRGGMFMVFAPDPAEARADRLLAMMGATEAGRVEIAALVERQVNGLLARLDTDRDGAVSQAEAEAKGERHRERGPRHERQRF